MKKKYIKPEFEVISSDLRATVMIGSNLDHAEAKRRQMEEMEAALMEEESHAARRIQAIGASSSRTTTT